MKINSLKEDLKHLQSDITTIGAVDYSKERLTGGGTPGGLEQQIIRLESKRDAVHKEIGALIDERETAADTINTCTTGKYFIIARIHRRKKRQACTVFYRFGKVASGRIKNGWPCTGRLLFASYILCVRVYG